LFHSDEKRVSYDDDDDGSLEVLLERLYDKYEDYDGDVVDVVMRVLWIQRDIDILGGPLIPPIEEELMGLRILADETDRFEKYKLEQAERKSEGS